jgi:hypothetical protein
MQPLAWDPAARISPYPRPCRGPQPVNPADPRTLPALAHLSAARPLAPVRRSNLSRWSEIQRAREPDTHSIGRFVKETLGSLELEPTILYSFSRVLSLLQREP